MKPPPRLVDDPSIAPALRADLERAATVDSDYDASVGLVSLQNALVAPSSPNVPPEVAGRGMRAAKLGGRLGSRMAKIGLLSAGAAAITAAVIVWSNRDRPPAPRPPATTAPTPAILAPQRPQLPQPQQPVQPSAEPSRARDPLPAPAERTHGRAIEAQAVLQREVAQLGRIKALLPDDPRQAYRLAQAGHREFRAGMLRQEREGLAIFALWELGRDAEAARRTRAFLTRYPESALREQLAQRLAREDPPASRER